MKKFIVLAGALILNGNLLAQVDQSRLQYLTNKSLRFVLNSQIKTQTPVYYPGEWPQKVEFKGFIDWLNISPGEKLDDPSAFTTATIANILLSAFPKGIASTPPEVRRAIKLATTSFPIYKVKDVYHFYPKTNIQIRSENGPKTISVNMSKLVRMAGKPFGWEINNGTLVPPDNDSTGVVYTTLFKVFGERMSKGAVETLTKHRDVNRDPYFFNKLHRNVKTGAFLTWLQDEPKFLSDRNLGPVGRTRSRLNYSMMSPENGSRIPFGRNDVDCVANTNAIRALALNQQKSVPGYQEACTLINKVFKTRQTNSCGIYYPNTFHLHFVASSAVVDGVDCLRTSLEQMKKDLLKHQHSDGSWVNKANIEVRFRNPDPALTTLYALATYINIAKMNPKLITQEVRNSFEKGLNYLDGEFFTDEEGLLKLPEGKFYSAFPPLRNTSAWTSEAYTMAIAFKVFKESSLVLGEN